jgi:hypothetical protein
MDREATKQRESEEAQQRAQREGEEAKKLEQEMREIEKLLPQVKGEELRKTLQEKYYQLLKKKLKKESEEMESEESESEAEPEVEPKEKEEEKLHGIKKFKIDEAMIDKILKSNHGQAHEFFVHLADILPKYFENDEVCSKWVGVYPEWDQVGEIGGDAI